MKIVAIGGSGFIGSKLVPRLRQRGDETVAASPHCGVNSVTSEGLGAPVNGTVEIAGPEPFRLDELVRRRLAQLNDPREVITDPQARYAGALLSERTLVPGKDAQLTETRFETWLTQPAAKTAAVAH